MEIRLEAVTFSEPPVINPHDAARVGVSVGGFVGVADVGVSVGVCVAVGVSVDVPVEEGV
jgi:hypothetical protein